MAEHGIVQGHEGLTLRVAYMGDIRDSDLDQFCDLLRQAVRHPQA